MSLCEVFDAEEIEKKVAEVRMEEAKRQKRREVSIGDREYERRRETTSRETRKRDENDAMERRSSEKVVRPLYLNSFFRLANSLLCATQR